MRVDRPIGTYLVMWPALWALMLAANGTPNPKLVIVFCAGAFLMRSAGCVINDYADRNWDGKVERTKNRPLATQRITTTEALQLFVMLTLLATSLLLWMNIQTFYWSLGAIFLATLYPFTKRFIQTPQLILGMAFAWAIPMAFAAQTNTVPLSAWVLYVATLFWVVAYDTFYAMVDREDDIKVGIKSTAILFGQFDRLITFMLQVLFLTAMLWVGFLFNCGLAYFVSLALVSLLIVYQQWLIKDRKNELCFKAFTNNHYVGMLLFIGLAIDALI